MIFQEFLNLWLLNLILIIVFVNTNFKIGLWNLLILLNMLELLFC